MDTRALWLMWSGRLRVATAAAMGAAAAFLAATPPARLWRRSLYFRVVSTTLVLSTVMVGVIGFIVASRLIDGLVMTQRSAAVAEARDGGRTLAATFSGAPSSEDELRRRMVSLVRTLSGRGSPAGLFDVVLVPPEGSVSAVSSGDADLDQVPQALVDSVESSAGLAYAYFATTQPDGSRGPALALGSASGSPAGVFHLYYLFPLGEMSDTVALVQRVMLASGMLLVIMLAAVSGMVTRQVVVPVRQARATAEKLAAGGLQHRMTVTGEDDLARLAQSFNHMADTLQTKIDELERLSAVQRGFVSDVSHELRTPLTTVRMAADVIYAAREEFPTDLARAAELLDAEVGRFESLLSDLLEISRHDVKVAELDAEWTDVGELVSAVAGGMASLAASQGCALEVHLPDPPAMAEIDARRIGRIVRNLIGNALEHGAGAPVTVTVASTGAAVGADGTAAAVAVVVADHGRGLRPGDAALVFNRFWRADVSRTRTIGGTGLGLAIAFEDARLHGGWLQAWGEPGRGARFRLTLPCRPGGHLADSPLPLEPEAWDGGGAGGGGGSGGGADAARGGPLAVRILSLPEAVR